MELSIRAAQSRSEHATRMLVGLQHEVTVWETRLVDLQACLTTCVGDCVLSVACLVYGSSFSPVGRKELFEGVRLILRDNYVPTSDFAPSDHFGSPLLLTHGAEQQRRQWRNHGLPANTQSQENAALLFGGKPLSLPASGVQSPQSPSKEKPSTTGLWTQKVLSQSSVVPSIPLTSKWPLIVDPQGIGVRCGVKRVVLSCMGRFHVRFVRRFVKRMCRSLGLLQESVEAEDSEMGTSFAVTRRLSSRREFASTSFGGEPSRKDRFKHKLIGGMDVLRHADPHLPDVLQTCMLVGRWVLVEAVGLHLAPCLIDAINAASQRSKLAQAGATGSPLALDALVDNAVPSVHPDFLLILATTASCCHYPPEVHHVCCFSCVHLFCIHRIAARRLLPTCAWSTSPFHPTVCGKVSCSWSHCTSSRHLKFNGIRCSSLWPKCCKASKITKPS